jgi:uncharacterized protein (DUF362 family)
MKTGRAAVSIVKGDIRETPEQYTAKDLKTVRGMIERSLDLIGGLESIIGKAKTVVVKPNLVEVPFGTTGGSVITDPRVLESVVAMLKDAGVERVLVAEGKSVNLKHIKSGPRETFAKTGLTEIIEHAGGEILGWDEEEFIPTDIPNGGIYDKIGLPRSIVEADAFISVPKLKTHCQTEITVGMKSMQGVYDVEEKQNFHNEAFPWKMVDILRVAKPTLTIVDGLICGEGYGPIYTDPVEMNLIVSSTDVVAIDAVCSEIMGIEASEVPITRLGHAEGIGIGVMDQIDVKGEKVEDVMELFSRSGIWNPIGYSKNIQIFAGGACRFCLAQVGATVKRLGYEDKLENLEDICVIIGHNAPQPVREYKHVYIIGDCAKDSKMDGTFIGGCPPLPSVQIVEAFSKHKKQN